MTKELIQQDIIDWIANYVEVNHKFYDYKFPPCPYARAARLKGLVDVVAYEHGSKTHFISTQIDALVSDKKHNVKIMVFPPNTRWNWWLKYYHIKNLNKKIIPQDYYIQYGFAIKTQSRYRGFGNTGPYFIVIANKLSDVLAGHQSLLSTNYYSFWANEHYEDVVLRRDNMYKKYHKK
jgi:hypothetical protein